MFQVCQQSFLKYMQLLILIFIIPTRHAIYTFIDLGKSNNSHDEMIEIGFLKILSMSEKYLNVLPCFRVLDNSYQIIFLTHLHLLSRKLKFEESKLNWLYGVPVNKFEVNTYVWEHLQLGSNVHIDESYFRVEKTLDIR